MTAQRHCPSGDALLGLLDGELDHDAAEGVRTHIDDCEDCRAVVARLLASTDTQPEAPEDLRGSVLAERYRIDRRLGQGAMAVVYAAWDQRLERHVALKAMAAGPRARARRFAERLLRESKAMARLRHPNVVMVHDVFQSAGRLYLAMELVEGQTLRQWLAAEDRPVPRILDVLRQAGRGLAAAHEVGLVHRDFKPDNVLVGADGRVLVTDFGLARGAEEESPHPTQDASTPDANELLTESGAVVGTPAYMAPEQWAGDPVDARCDVFAFCVTAFEALYGRRPFEAGTLKGLQKAKLRGRCAQPPRSDVPAAVRRTIDAGLCPAPKDRAPAMADVVARLHGPRRRPLALAGGIGVGTIALGLAAAWAFAGDRHDDPCPSPDPLADEWTAAQRDRIAQAAPDGWRRVERGLDEHIAAWRDAWKAACAATGSTPEEETALALERSCLEIQGRGIRAAVHVLESEASDAEDAVRALPPVTACASDRLGVLRPMPEDPVLRAEVEELLAEIGEAQVQQTAGLNAEVELKAEDLVARARRTGYAPIIADALYLQGTNASFLGDARRARAILVESAQAAAAGSHDVAAAETLIYLVRVVSGDLGDIEGAREYAAMARGAIDRLGDAPVVPQIEVRFAEHVAQLEIASNNYGAAETALLRGLALAREELPDHVIVLQEALAIVYGSTDRLDESIALHREVLADRLATLEESHPEVVLALSNLSTALMQAGEYEEALDLSTRAMKAGEGEARRFAALNRAEMLRMFGRNDEALEQIQQLLRWMEERGQDWGVYGLQLESVHASVLFDLDRTEEAIEIARRALREAEELKPGAETTNGLRIMLSENLADVGQTEEALALARRAVRTVEAMPEVDPIQAIVAYHAVAYAQLAAGQIEEAVTGAEDVVARYGALKTDQGMLVEGQVLLARALWEAGKRSRSKALVAHVLSVEPGHAEARAWADAHGL